MNHMIYIYAALAFIIAGGSGFICFHAGLRIGKREGKRDADVSEYRRGYLTANAVNASILSDYKGGYTYKDTDIMGGAVLSDLIHNHIERMDRDE